MLPERFHKVLKNASITKKFVAHQKIKVVQENLISMICESFILELSCLHRTLTLILVLWR